MGKTRFLSYNLQLVSPPVPSKSPSTYRQAPVNMGHPDMQVEAEDEEEDSRHDEGTAAHKLEEVDASTGWTHHDGLYTDESNKC